MATPEYRVWQGMIKRCYHPKTHAFERYGGAGITVCDEWRHDFNAFLRDMGPRPTNGRYTLERRDGTAGYNAMNCYWATYTEQNRNRSICHPIAGYSSIAEAAEAHGIPHGAIRARLRLGWSEHDAVSKPINPLRRGNRHR